VNPTASPIPLKRLPRPPSLSDNAKVALVSGVRRLGVHVRRHHRIHRRGTLATGGDVVRGKDLDPQPVA